MSVLELDRDKWKQFKTDNNLSKSSFFKKADVGPTIDKFQDAIVAYRKSKSKKDLMSAFKKAEDLQKAFAKFINLKEAKDELSTAAKQKIQKWSGQLDNVAKVLAKTYDEHKEKLEANDVKELDKTLNEILPF